MRYIFAISMAAAAVAASAQYTATVLHPPGFAISTATGVYGSNQVGTAQQPGIQGFFASGTGASAVGLTPASLDGSQCAGIFGNMEVGDAWGVGTGEQVHAFLWTGSPASAIDLNPAGFVNSHATAVYNNTQVGWGHGSESGALDHALLWTGTAGSAVDLNPAGFASYALGVYGNSQVGYGSGPSMAGQHHALLWTGTVASVVDLNPTGYSSTIANGVFGNFQTGYGTGPATGGFSHALLWAGSASNFVDLNPAGFDSSIADGISGNYQVGYGSGSSTNGATHALVWNGSANSFIDLQQFLTGLSVNGNALVASGANAIDDNGDIVGFGADIGGDSYAVMWKPIRAVSGTVVLQNLVSAAVPGTMVTIELRSPGTTTVLESETVPVNSGGMFSFRSNLPPGTYDVTAKASHWLRQRLSNQNVGIFGNTTLSFSLINGDINGDNRVTLSDFALFKAAFGSSVGGSNYNPNADLNGDGHVTLTDFAIFKSNFGKQGDP